MNWIAVAGDLGEADHVGGRHGFSEPLGHAEREVLEVQRLQGQHRHAPVDSRGRHTAHTRPLSSTLISASALNPPMVASAPLASINSAPADGASACTIRLGNASLPIRRGNRIGPNSASGSVTPPTSVEE